MTFFSLNLPSASITIASLIKVGTLNTIKKNKAFFSHQAEKGNLKPITRSSAVFYFKHTDDFTTCIHFLNYWKIKRGLNNIEIFATIRGMNGNVVLKSPIELPKQGSVEIYPHKLLSKELSAKSIFEGSIEIEIFSNENLFVAYPAMVVRYSGKNWHTTAHSSQRYFSTNSADENFDEFSFAEEGNQTIHTNPKHEPFWIIHNGSKEFVDSDAYVEITSNSGAVLKKKIPNLTWQAFETKLFYLKDYINYRKILNDEIGTFRIGYTNTGVFPRVIAGYQNSNSGLWSIDHTNFAAKDGPVLDDQFDVNKEKDFKNLVFNIPSLSSSQNSLTCFADIYPTYPNEKYTIEVSRNASSQVQQEDFCLPTENNLKITRINLNGTHNSELNFMSNQKLPRRFHTGIHYAFDSDNPGFLIDGPMPYTTEPISTRWSPLFFDENTENFLMIANRSLGDFLPTDIKFSAKIYNSFSDDPIDFEFLVPKNDTKIINFEKDIPNFSKYLNRESAWIYMKSNIPSYCVVHYLSKKNQSVACDHAF